jgi:uncharacterized surface protein with fasciclin (FAS1) repeats
MVNTLNSAKLATIVFLLVFGLFCAVGVVGYEGCGSIMCFRGRDFSSPRSIERRGYSLGKSSFSFSLDSAASSEQQQQYSSSDTILDVLSTKPEWSTFRTLLSAMPEFTETMNNKDLILDTIYTVFVPTNDAFAKLDKDILFKIGKKDNLPILRKLVRHHFVDDVMSVEDMGEVDKIMTLALLEINVRPAQSGMFGGILGSESAEEIANAAGGIRLNDGIITDPDIQCCNGVIHEVNTLLNPFLYYRYLV